MALGCQCQMSCVFKGLRFESRMNSYWRVCLLYCRVKTLLGVKGRWTFLRDKMVQKFGGKKWLIGTEGKKRLLFYRICGFPRQRWRENKKTSWNRWQRTLNISLNVWSNGNVLLICVTFTACKAQSQTLPVIHTTSYNHICFICWWVSIGRNLPALGCLLAHLHRVGPPACLGFLFALGKWVGRDPLLSPLSPEAKSNCSLDRALTWRQDYVCETKNNSTASSPVCLRGNLKAKGFTY